MAIQRYDVLGPDGNEFEVRYWSPINRPVMNADGDISYIIHRVENVTAYIQLSQENQEQKQRTTELSLQNRSMEAEILQRGQALDKLNSELRNANAALIQYAQQTKEEGKNKDEFLAMLAHELRNPLASISSAIELLGMVERDPGRIAQIRDICRRQIGNLTRMVNDLLDASRIGRGAIALQYEPLDLRDIVTNALHASRAKLDRLNLAVNTDITSGTYLMRGDSTRLEQVVVNLLDNAAKFSEAGGQISILLTNESAGQAKWAVLQVKDKGRGIPPEKLNLIFDMFMQADTTLDRSRGGLGIGLTLVQRLVEMHDGNISATSQGPGHGSTFTVRLPVDAALALPTASLPEQPVDLLKNRRSRVVIIEDNIDAQTTLKAILEAYGFDVAVADDGEAGLQLLQATQPDVAIVDIGLPMLDGFEVARRTRALPLSRRIKLVALSGYSDPGTKTRATDAGFDVHLVKPVNPAELTALLL
jgi:signal transduction histidine kinase